MSSEKNSDRLKRIAGDPAQVKLWIENIKSSGLSEVVQQAILFLLSEDANQKNMKDEIKQQRADAISKLKQQSSPVSSFIDTMENLAQSKLSTNGTVGHVGGEAAYGTRSRPTTGNRSLPG